MTKVVKFPSPPTPDECLQNCIGRLDEVMIVGYDDDGNLIMNGTVDVDAAYFLLMLAASTLLDECKSNG